MKFVPPCLLNILDLLLNLPSLPSSNKLILQHNLTQKIHKNNITLQFSKIAHISGSTFLQPIHHRLRKIIIHNNFQLVVYSLNLFGTLFLIDFLH